MKWCATLTCFVFQKQSAQRSMRCAFGYFMPASIVFGLNICCIHQIIKLYNQMTQRPRRDQSLEC